MPNPELTKGQLYGRRWRVARRLFLAANPLCVFCLSRSRSVPATIVDHITPHAFDPVLFWDESNWQSLCQPCHDGLKQRSEQFSPRQFSIPHDMRPSEIPVHIVVGPPGGGKTTFVRQRARPTDRIIDFDDISESLGYERYTRNAQHVRKVLAARDVAITGLAQAKTGEAWFIVMAPTDAERRAWLDVLGPLATLHRCDTSHEECLSRLSADPKRHRQIAVLDEYFIKRERGRGFSCDVDVKGWPVDPKHPVYSTARKFQPEGLKVKGVAK